MTNQKLIDNLLKTYEVPNDWNGNKVNMWCKNLFCPFSDPVVFEFKLDSNLPQYFYFNNLTLKENKYCVEIYKRTYPNNILNITTGFSLSFNNSNNNTNQNNTPTDEYIVTVIISDDNIDFLYDGFFGSSKIPKAKHQTYLDLFNTGLQKYGIMRGGRSRRSSKRRSLRKKSMKKTKKYLRNNKF
jgi:hypothetical protein